MLELLVSVFRSGFIFHFLFRMCRAMSMNKGRKMAAMQAFHLSIFKGEKELEKSKMAKRIP